MTSASSPSLPSRTLAVCGFKGSGKTTLLEEVVGELGARGLSVGVVKTDAHGIRVDAEGTDSQRLFDAGAEVVVRGPGDCLGRWRVAVEAEEPSSIEEIARRLERRHDVVLVEGGKGSALPKVWLGRADSPEPPTSTDGVTLVLPWNGPRAPALLRHLDAWLREAWATTPLAGGVLAGGGSRRMGSRKETLQVAGESLLQRTGGILSELLDPVVRLGGEGGSWPSLPDPPGLEGPLAGMLAATRWLPESSWVFVACDQPRFRSDALEWLLSRREPGVWAVIPHRNGNPQPLSAVYEPMMAEALERLARSARPAPSQLVGRDRVRTPEIPDGLADAFESANTPREWERLTGPEEDGL